MNALKHGLCSREVLLRGLNLKENSAQCGRARPFPRPSLWKWRREFDQKRCFLQNEPKWQKSKAIQNQSLMKLSWIPTCRKTNPFLDVLPKMRQTVPAKSNPPKRLNQPNAELTNHGIRPETTFKGNYLCIRRQLC